MGHMMKDLDDVCDMKEALMRKVRGSMDHLDVENSTLQDVQGMDMMINMIHHLAEAEKCCWEACYYKTVVKAMKDGEDRQDWDDDDDDWMQHDDTPKRRHYDRMVGRRRYGMERSRPGDDRRTWGSDDMDGTIQHGDMTGMRMTRDMSSMTPDERLNHLKMDVETMWKDATPEQRKRLKESLTKWSASLTV